MGSCLLVECAWPEALAASLLCKTDGASCESSARRAPVLRVADKGAGARLRLVFGPLFWFSCYFVFACVPASGYLCPGLRGARDMSREASRAASSIVLES